MRTEGRRFSVIVLAVAALAGGIWVLTGALGVRAWDDYVIGSFVVPDEIVRLLGIAWAGMLIASAALVFLAHRWGWALLMIATGVGLLLALWQWWIGNHEPVRMAIFVVTAFYLNASESRELLLQPSTRTTAVPLAPPDGGDA